jgi:hypothetical protein
MKLGSDIARGPWIGEHSGLECQAIGRRPLNGVIDHLSAIDAMHAAHRLELIDDSQPSLEATSRYEKWWMQGVMTDLFRHKDWRYRAFGNGYGQPDNGDQTLMSNLIFRFLVNTDSPRAAYDNYSLYLDEETAMARLSWPEQKAAKQPKLPNDIVAAMWAPDSPNLPFKMTGTLALNRLVDTQLALQAYKCEHGAYPASLSDLVPTYLTRVPDDPFSNHQPLVYRLTGSNYLLYSIGPDAKDDGGKPCVQYMTKKPIYRVMLDSEGEKATGDIVAGVNN